MYHVLAVILLKIVLTSGDTYTVKIDADQHVNLIDSRFLSFTIDPKYLFSTSKKYGSKECICMASSLTPAFIRIAGPSTALMSYHNSSISLHEPEDMQPGRSRFQTFFKENLARIDEALSGSEDTRRRRYRPRTSHEGIPRRPRTEDTRFKRNHERLEVSHEEWRRFVRWASSTGFDLVFALNNEEKMASGMWDPNMALNILTVAEKAKVGDIFWQLGYECTNQSIEEYLNDLETLRVITETFPAGRAAQWRVVGGDVTGCLQADSKSDFKDYVTLSSDMMDAVLLNGNSSTVELDRMSERDRLKLLKLLSHSSTPLWLTEPRWLEGPMSEVSRAADWLTSLGHAARNGFSVHYRELDEEEMYQPTLSFYMALLFKNLVGDKVLNVDMEPEQAIMFAHCTSLRHKAVPGAVTLYGVNMDDEPARFSIKLAKREEGGDIMQFVIGHDKSGNIVVNGRAMYHEGDLKPVVKRVRPYKTLLVNLPAKTFGFWVLANTKIEACFADENFNETENVDEAVSVSEELEVGDVKAKRSINVQDFEEYTNSDVAVDFCDENDVTGEIENEDLKSRLIDINENLREVEQLFKPKYKDARIKRQVDNEIQINKKRKLTRPSLKNRYIKAEPEKKPRRLLGNLLQSTKHNISKLLKTDRLRLLPRHNKNKLSKRQSNVKPKKIQTKRKENSVVQNENVRNKENKRKITPAEKIREILEETPTVKGAEEKVRTRRNTRDQVELSAENEVDIDVKDNAKLWKMLHKIHKQFKDLSEESDDYVDALDTDDLDLNVITKTHKHKKVDDVDMNDDTTFIKSTLFNLLRVVSDLNKNLNKFWNGMRFLD